MKKYLDSHPFAKAGLFAISLLFFIVGMDHYFPKNAPAGYKSFIVAFEFARTPEDVHALLDSLSVTEIINTETGNYIDFGFMLFYSVFLSLFFLQASSVFNKKWAFLGIPLSIVVFFADLFENVILLKITKAYLAALQDSVFLPLLKGLHLITSIKWFGLAAAFFMVSILLFRKGWLSKFAAISAILPLGIAIGGNMQSPNGITLFTNSIFLAFGVLILYSFIFRKSVVV
jgi:hypothetical protein